MQNVCHWDISSLTMEVDKRNDNIEDSEIYKLIFLGIYQKKIHKR